GMPSPLLEAVALHHSPGQSAHKEFSLVTAVHVADAIAHERESDTDGIVAPKLDSEYLTALNLAGKVDLWRKSIAFEKKPSAEEQPASVNGANGTVRTERVEAAAEARPKTASTKVVAAPPPVVTARTTRSTT